MTAMDAKVPAPRAKEDPMSQQSAKALQVARAYYDAWTSKDLERAMSYIAGDIVCDVPAGHIEGAEAYRAFLAPFVQILERAELIAAFGDDQTAVLIYDTETVPVPSAPAAECVTVRDGKIVHSRFVFDRVPFEAARQAPA
jgi:ketosteroid isomerase-like protein